MRRFFIDEKQTAVQIASANVSRGNYSSNVSAREQLYFCLRIVGSKSELTVAQAYSPLQKAPGE